MKNEKQIQEIVDSCKRHYNVGNIPEAWVDYCSLFDNFEYDFTQPGSYNRKISEELFFYTNQLPDQLIYDVTDYGKNRYFAQ